jgi:mannose/fructose/N-acetylgalactosamine-specific phosphotransferase system component IID
MINPVTKDDILQIASRDPIVQSCVNLHQVQGVTWEEAMMSAVCYLVEQKEELVKEIYEKNSKEPEYKMIGLYTSNHGEKEKL